MTSELPKAGIMERLYAVIAIVIGVIVLLGLLGQQIIVGISIPPENIVYIDEVSHIYYAPPYILGNKYPAGLDISNLKGKTVYEAQKEKYVADSKCVEMGYFKEKYTVTDFILVKIGLIQPPPSRWNPDGSWNW